MERKSKKKQPEAINATAIAARAGCSRQLVSRLLARGFDERRIVERIAERKARESARNKAATVVSSAPPPSYSGPVNGFPAPHGYPPFAESEAKKEAHLAELRGLEVAKAKGELFPLQPLMAITVGILRFQRDLLWLLPHEAGQELSMRTEPEVASILHRHLEHMFHAVEAFAEGECRKYAVAMPAAPPAPTRSQLAYYERYRRDSRDGEIEVIPVCERIDSKEWMAAHPSVTFEQGFVILRKKKEWDKAMGELLAKRSEWDLPVEAPVEPSPLEDDVV
jgi:hypothetical protein